MPHVKSIDDVQKIYLIGICGSAMASLAGMLQKRGFDVGGSDENVYPPMSTYLKKLGIPILEGYTKEHVETFRPDLVVIGNAASKTNAEAAAVLEMDLPYTSMPEAIYELFIRGKHSVVITGTHGKTTATSLMAWMLESAGRDTSFVVGGIPVNFGHNFKLGDGREFVIEGDEYNTAFFDKGPKFLHYNANSLLVNNIEFDHADIFDSLEPILEAFRQVIADVDEKDLIVANGDDPHVVGLREHARARWKTFGLGENCDARAFDLKFDEDGSSFDVEIDGSPLGKFRTPMSGVHNAMNALANIVIAHDLGLDADAIREGLRSFRGIKRRMEIRGIEKGVTVIDDFAHHPTAIETTLQGARNMYPGRRIWALYEPRSATSGRTEFEEGYKTSFAVADRVVIGPIYHKKRYGNTYPADKMMSVESIVDSLDAGGTPSSHIEDFDELARYVADQSEPGDVVIAMSSGAFGGIHEKLLEQLRRR